MNVSRPQISLRALFLVVALTAIGIVVVTWFIRVNRGDRMRRLAVEAAREISSSGGQITRNDAGDVVKVRFPWKGDDALLARVAHFPLLKTLDLSYCVHISDDGIAAIGPLPQLSELLLYRNGKRVTDKSLFLISKLPALESLMLWDNQFTDTGIMPLRSCQYLKELGVRSPLVTRQALDDLSRAIPKCRITYDDHT